MNKIETINRLKKEKDAVILAHYYVPQEIQEVADYIGDSYYLSKIATQVKQNTIVFCGVNFMGESAKTLNPHKTVLMPDLAADCPMAHMANLDEIGVTGLKKNYGLINDDFLSELNGLKAIKTYKEMWLRQIEDRK